MVSPEVTYRSSPPQSVNRWVAGLPERARSIEVSRSAEQLAQQDVPDDKIEVILDDQEVDVVLREHKVIPPALSTNGARNLMKRLCEEAGVDVDGDYLKPHGARRGLGHELYANGHAELAQSALRHASIETTHKSYSDIRAAETAQQVDDLLKDYSLEARKCGDEAYQEPAGGSRMDVYITVGTGIIGNRD